MKLNFLFKNLILFNFTVDLVFLCGNKHFDIYAHHLSFMPSSNDVTEDEASYKLPSEYKSCGHSQYWNPDRYSGLIGGVSVMSYELPWTVKLLFFGQHESWLCSGSLIDDDAVLTAGHCCKTSTHRVELYLGSNDSNEYLEQREVWISNIFRHPDYSESSQLNDFCVIKLYDKINTEKSWEIRKICLPDSCEESCQPEDIGMISGWGSHNGENVDADLTKALVPIWTLDECISSYGPVEYTIDDSHVCAGTRMGSSSTCFGDSGTSLVCYKHGHFSLDGVASWEALPCGSSHPTVFGRVCHEPTLNWIKSFINLP